MNILHSLPQAVEHWASVTPDALFVAEVGGRACTYSEAHTEVLRWANLLQSFGVVRDDRVLVMLPNSLEAIHAWMALSWLGAVEVSVNTGYKGRLLERVINDSAARLMIVHDDFLGVVSTSRETCAGIERLIVVGLAPDVALPAGAAALNLPLQPLASQGLQRPRSRDIAALCYTSGTTGASKGVVVTWRQYAATIVGFMPRDGLSASDHHYSPLPLFHMGGKLMVGSAADLGAGVVIRPRFSTSEFWRDVSDHRCTTTMFIGSMANFLQAAEPTSDEASSPLAHVAVIPLPHDIKAFTERFGVRVTSCYNSTEISVPITTGWSPATAGTCGRLREGYQVRIVDSDDREVPAGQVGEFMVRADEPWALSQGYWQNAEATVAAFRNLWYHTGDAGRRDADGNYFFVDRMKDAIRRRGENISSLELEAIVGEHPSVAEVAAVGVPSEWGEEEVKVVIVRRLGTTLDPDELCAFVAERAPNFMVPRYVEIVADLPRTPNEKVQKSILKASGNGDRTWDRLAEAPDRRTSKVG